MEHCSYLCAGGVPATVSQAATITVIAGGVLLQVDSRDNDNAAARYHRYGPANTGPSTRRNALSPTTVQLLSR